MLTYEKQRKLVLALTNAEKSAPVAYSFGEDKFSYNELNETVRNELNELYKADPKAAFALIAESLDEYLPKNVLAQYGQFAEVQHFAQGDKPVFITKVTEASKRRAKQFVSRVGLAGRYEAFKLDGRKIEVATAAYGGAANIGLEEYLDGRVDFTEILAVLNEALAEQVYYEIEKSLVAAFNSLQANNKVTANAFIETKMDKLLSVADSYGTGKSTIYCTFEFAATMIPSTGWVGGAWSEAMKDKYWTQGYLGDYKGHRVIVLEQSFTDEKNNVKVIDPSMAWIMPNSAEKPVKVAFEGVSQVRELDNLEDWSRELQTYTKFGVATNVHNNICAYKNSTLVKAFDVNA